MTDATFTCFVNGEHRDLPPHSTVPELLREMGLQPEQPGLAVAVNEKVIRRAAWPQTTLHEGDRVEVITATQGG